MNTANLQEKIPEPRLDTIKGKLRGVPKYIWILIALLIIILITLAFLYRELLSELAQKSFRPSSQEQRENIATPAEPRIAPLAHGRQIYSISGGTKGGPQMTQAVIDPIDPQPNQIQTLTIKANNLKPIVEITAKVVTDNEENINYLKLIEGTDTNGVWQGNWQISDEYNYNYQIVLIAKNNEDIESKTTLTFR